MKFFEIVLNSLSVPILILLMGIICLFILLLLYFVNKRQIAEIIDSSLENWDSGENKISLEKSDCVLLFFGTWLEKLSIKYGVNLPVLTGLDDLWIKQINRKKTKKSVLKVLKYSPDKGLFTILKAALEKEKLQTILMEWINKSGEFLVLRKIALSGNGEAFDGKAALKLFSNDISELNEMLGDYEWKTRFFATNILIHDTADSSLKAVWAGFNDPSVFVRIVPVQLLQTDNRKKLYSKLEYLLLNDPSFDVRKAAKDRISTDFQDLYKIIPTKLTITQKLHLIELMDPYSKQDENLALELLKSGNKELELYASRFLLKTGTLQRLLFSADTGYLKAFEDIYSALQIAVRVNITSFIELSENNISTGALLISSRILIKNGDRNIINNLLQKSLEITKGKENIQPYKELYENSILCACRRGTDEALELLNNELLRRRYDRSFQEWILPILPDNRENIFAPTLISFLKDEKYNTYLELEKSLCRFPAESILTEIIDILKSNNKWSKSIKINSLKVLGALKLPHCTQYILENLYLLSIEEANQYSVLLSKNDNSAFRDKVKNILSFGDAISMSHLIAALPDAERKTFLPEIKKSLSDSNPEVRIAAMWSLSDYNNGELLALCFNLLRDPVELVREEVGRVLGTLGSAESIRELKQTLFDKNESNAVKIAVLKGLAISSSSEVLDILLLKLEENIELQDDIVISISRKNNPDDIKKILAFMEKTTSPIRTYLVRAIRLMGEKAELFIEELLFKGNKVLHKHAVAILEENGIVDLRIRQLAHRDPEIRLKAAEFLAKAGTKKAFRGIILSAKDPDTRIRVQLVKALDQMTTAEGLPVLEELKDDPEKRVRKYTLWALERYEAKNLI